MSLPSLIRVYTPGAEAGPLDPADIFTSALGGIFTDDAQNSHGDPGAAVVYRPSWAAAGLAGNDSESRYNHGDIDSRGEGKEGANDGQKDGDRGKGGDSDGNGDGDGDADDGTLPTDLVLRLTDPTKEDGRLLYAHYLWNASVLAAELVGRVSTSASLSMPESSSRLLSAPQSTTATTATTTTTTTDTTTPSTTSTPSGPANSAGTLPTITDETLPEAASQQEAKPRHESDEGPSLPLGPLASSHNWSVRGHRVLELGAGTGLAGIVCGTAGGAAETWVTDYPARDVLDNIQANVAANAARFERVRAMRRRLGGDGEGADGLEGDTNGSGDGIVTATADASAVATAVNIKVAGHKWGDFGDATGDEGRDGSAGADTQEADGGADDDGTSVDDGVPPPHSFTRIIAADCLWMAWEHGNLARSMSHFLSDDSDETHDAEVWVVAGFHTGRPKVAAFFDEVARQGELRVAKRWEVGVDFTERCWDPDRLEDVGERKRWLVVAVLRRVGRV